MNYIIMIFFTCEMLTGTFRYEFNCETFFSHLVDVLKMLTDY